MIGAIVGGKYRIVEQIGTGGMANVYRVTQVTGAHRTFALKMLKDEFLGDDAFIRRFEQEAKSVIGLSHDNIVRSYDVGEWDGRPYIVFEYVAGKTIKEIMREKGAFSPQRTVQLGAQLLEALSHAHSRGIIHRDVKPQNVIVTPRSKAKLTDFGIARDVSSNTMTYAGTNVLGSVHYLSPEQAKGVPVTVESDIYSMGIALYEMATGELPFTGETPVAIALMHLQGAVPPPSSKNPRIRRALNDVILKATRKDPSKRYHSAKSMRVDLLRSLREPDGDFVHLYDEEPRQRSAKRKKGIKASTSWRMGILTLLMMGMFFILFLMGQAYLSPEEKASTELVPTLEGKTYEEAQSLAELRGYTIEVGGEAHSDAYGPGIVLDQTPDASTEYEQGSIIQVIVSEGAYMPEVPQLYGLTLQEAQTEIIEAGLTMAEPEYRVCEEPVGTVFQQDPEAGTMLFEGDTVRVFISGEPSKSIDVPNVTNLLLPEALELLDGRGFSNLIVSYEEALMADAVPNMVYWQYPAPDERILSTDVMNITAQPDTAPPYEAEIAFTVDIAEDDSTVRITSPATDTEVPYEHQIFIRTMDEGEDQVISFSGTCPEGGERDVILYVNGEKIRTTKFVFSVKEQQQELVASEE